MLKETVETSGEWQNIGEVFEQRLVEVPNGETILIFRNRKMQNVVGGKLMAEKCMCVEGGVILKSGGSMV